MIAMVLLCTFIVCKWEDNPSYLEAKHRLIGFSYYIYNKPRYLKQRKVSQVL